jgi:hypothetical protein
MGVFIGMFRCSRRWISVPSLGSTSTGSFTAVTGMFGAAQT